MKCTFVVIVRCIETGTGQILAINLHQPPQIPRRHSTTMSSLLTIVLVPGAYHLPSHYAALISALHSTASLSIPSPFLRLSMRPARATMILQPSPPPSLTVTTWFFWCIRMVALLAPKVMPGLNEAEREKGGRKGGVVKLMYIAALALDQGFNVLQGIKTPAPFVVEEKRAAWLLGAFTPLLPAPAQEYWRVEFG